MCTYELTKTPTIRHTTTMSNRLIALGSASVGTDEMQYASGEASCGREERWMDERMLILCVWDVTLKDVQS